MKSTKLPKGLPSPLSVPYDVVARLIAPVMTWPTAPFAVSRYGLAVCVFAASSSCVSTLVLGSLEFSRKYKLTAVASLYVFKTAVPATLNFDAMHFPIPMAMVFQVGSMAWNVPSGAAITSYVVAGPSGQGGTVSRVGGGVSALPNPPRA